MGIMASGSSSVQPDPDLVAFYRELGRYSPDFARLVEPVPAEVEPSDVDAASVAWWAEASDKSEWWADLGRDDVQDSYGEDAESCDLDGAHEVEVYLRARGIDPGAGLPDEYYAFGGHPT